MLLFDGEVKQEDWPIGECYPFSWDYYDENGAFVGGPWRFRKFPIRVLPFDESTWVPAIIDGVVRETPPSLRGKTWACHVRFFDFTYEWDGENQCPAPDPFRCRIWEELQDIRKDSRQVVFDFRTNSFEEAKLFWEEFKDLPERNPYLEYVNQEMGWVEQMVGLVRNAVATKQLSKKEPVKILVKSRMKMAMFASEFKGSETLEGLLSALLKRPVEVALDTSITEQFQISGLAPRMDPKKEAEIKSLETLLANEGFIRKAPEHVVQEKRDQLAKLKHSNIAKSEKLHLGRWK